MPEGYNGAYTGQQIDEGIAKANGALPQSGGVMTGPLSLAGDPAGENEATRKAYVDNVTQAVQSNLTAHTGNTNNPHGVTAEQVGAAASAHTHSSGDITSGVTNNTSTASSIAGSTNLPTMNTLRYALNRTTSVGAADTSYTTYMARGTALRSSEATPSYNGQICWVYE